MAARFSKRSVMISDSDLWCANWGNTAFFFVATLIQINLALYAQKVFHLKPAVGACTPWLRTDFLGLRSLPGPPACSSHGHGQRQFPRCSRDGADLEPKTIRTEPNSRQFS